MNLLISIQLSSIFMQDSVWCSVSVWVIAIESDVVGAEEQVGERRGN